MTRRFPLTNSAGSVTRVLELPEWQRVPSSERSKIEHLKSKGWRAIETLETWMGPLEVSSDQDCLYAKPLRAEELDEVCKLAEHAFVHDRHHADPQVAPADADAFKAQWVRNAARHVRRTILVSHNFEGRVDGFIVAMVVGKTLIVDLIAVHPDARRRGIAHQMIFEAAARSHTTMIMAGTQSTNVEAQKLYASLGMKVAKTEITLHK